MHRLPISYVQSDERTFFIQYILLELYHLYFFSALNIHKTPICTLPQSSLKVHENALILIKS